MLVYKAKLHNVFKKPDYEDKKTGQVTKAKYQLEFLEQKEMIQGQGLETVLEKISIPDELYPKYQDKVGQIVEVIVGAMVNNNRIKYYGVNRKN